MAYVTLDTAKLKYNYRYLNQLFDRNGIQWSIVSKLLCGNEKYLTAVLGLGIKQICDSRLANLRIIKTMAPEVETIFIKPPAKRNASRIVEYADISCNTSIATIRALSDAAVAQNKIHKIIIMVETGELREGVMPPLMPKFYAEVRTLPSIEVVGLGTNLTCMYGVLPDYDNLKQLELLQDVIEEKFGETLPLLSGGASVTIPLVENGELPASINHFRVGESLFFGTDVYNNTVLEHMRQDLFTLYAEIIELREKPNMPEGKMGYNLAGEKKTFPETDMQAKSMRAIVDVGLLDIDTSHATPMDENLRIAGASSDMIVIDLNDNDAGYTVGDKIAFRLDYMGALRIMHSKYIEKRIETHARPAVELAKLN